MIFTVKFLKAIIYKNVRKELCACLYIKLTIKSETI